MMGMGRAEVDVNLDWLLNQEMVLSCTVCQEPIYAWRGAVDALRGMSFKGLYTVRRQDGGMFRSLADSVTRCGHGYELRCLATPDCRGHADLAPLSRLLNVCDTVLEKKE
jgi:hypothetical protein